MKRKNPFEVKVDQPIEVDWQEGKFLEYDQSSPEQRGAQELIEDEKKPFAFKTVYYLLLIMAIVFFFRLFDLSVLRGQEFFALAEGNHLRVQKLLAPRGIIYDRYGEELAYNQPSFELVLTPLSLPKDQQSLEAVVSSISDFFKVDAGFITELISSVDRASFSPVTVKRNIEYETALAFITQQDQYPGFSIQNNPQRVYRDGPIYAHVIGYTGKLSVSEYEELKEKGYLFNDEVGKSGLEAKYEPFLRGELGERLVEVDAKGTIKSTFQEKSPQTGSSLYLNIDAALQKVLYEALMRQSTLRRAKRAAAVALDPRNGAVRALVSLPSFDNNWFAQGITPDQFRQIVKDADLPLFNRVISGTYPPGSTIKPFLAPAALQEGIVSKSTRIFDGGRLVVPNQFDPSKVHIFRGWNLAGLGNVDAVEAIAMSSDIYFYTIGGGQSKLGISGLGPNLIADYLGKFFLGKVTGIDLMSEKAGLLPTPEWKAQKFASDKIQRKWFLGDTYNMSIGQGFMLATPLQIAVATAAVANGGVVYQPRIVEKITDSEGNTLEQWSPRVLNANFLDEEYLEVARKGMRQAVTSGTASYLASLPIAVAGKTGTSQFDNSDLSRTHAWFTAFAPYEDPQLVLTILIEAGGEGSGAAVPVAREVFDWFAKNRL